LKSEKKTSGGGKRWWSMRMEREEDIQDALWRVMKKDKPKIMS
jgi:hypothetical protein